MSSGGAGGNKLHIATVLSVTESYGTIALDGNDPVPAAFFDQTSVAGTVDDLTKLFSKGSKVSACIVLAGSEHDVKYKASSLVLANQKLDSSIRGGDQYLKNYLEMHGPRSPGELTKELAVATGNCPKFLRNCDQDVIARVVTERPDWFEMRNGILHLCEMEIKIKNFLASQMKAYKGKISFAELEDIIQNTKKHLNYLRGDKSIIHGLKEFVLNNADTFILWDDCIWMKEFLHNGQQLNEDFQQELEAVKYYSQFATNRVGTLAATSLSGHWGQASDAVKKVASTKPSEFNAFLKRNSFFFELNENGDIENCPADRLEVIARFWSQNSVPVKASNQDLAANLNAKQQRKPVAELSSDGFFRSDSEKELKEYLQRFLQKNGAKRCSELLSELSSKDCPDCPVSLKRNSLRNLSRQYPELFSIRNGFFCLTSLEDALVSEIYRSLKDGRLLVSEIRLVISANDGKGKYLFASGVCECDCANFLERNADRFLVWENSICDYKHVFGKCTTEVDSKTPFECEMKAVQYYSGFVKDGGTEIVSLRGHFAQAPPDVRALAHSKEDDFIAFLKRNSFFFDVEGSKVQVLHKDRLKVIEQYWLNEESRAAALEFVSYSTQEETCPPSHSPTPVSIVYQAGPVLPSKVPPVPQSESPKLVKTPVQVSKAFNDVTMEISPGKNCFQNQAAPLVSSRNEAQAPSAFACPSSFELQTAKPDQAVRKSGIYSSPDAKMFKKLIGDSMSHLIEVEICSTQCPSLNNLFLLRLNIGRSPMANFRIPGDNSVYNRTLDTKPIETQDLHRIIRHKKVVRMKTPSHFGVKGTLHSIRSYEQNGKLVGLTLFCQLHEEDNGGYELDIREDGKLTAVFAGDSPKQVYNYLRCKCKQLAQTEDVLVIDMEGQLSGCDESPHPSLGKVTRRILCSSPLELSQAITESIQHKHQYIVVIEVESTEQLKLIQKLCSKGAQVLANVSSDLKTEVEKVMAL